MAVRVNAPAFRDLVDEDAELEQLGDGCTFTEGPLWNPDGGFLLFSDMPGDVRRRWDEGQTGFTEVANPSNKGNGMTFDLEGRLVVCEHVTSSRRAHGPRRHRQRPRGPRLALRRQGAQQPERRRRQERRRDLLHRPDLRAHARLRRSSASRTSTSRASTASRPAAATRSSSPTTSPSPTACASRPTSRCSTSTTPTARTSASSTSRRTGRCRTGASSPTASAPRASRSATSSTA